VRLLDQAGILHERERVPGNCVWQTQALQGILKHLWSKHRANA
jgi:hypothetical protein